MHFGCVLFSGIVLGCPCRLVPEWGVTYCINRHVDSCKGTLVAAAGPVWKTHVQFGFVKCQCDILTLVFVSPFMVAVLTHVFLRKG